MRGGRLVKSLFSIVTNKKGDEMVEASISMPIIILAIILLLRLFTFYLSILTTGINEHEEALDAWDKYSGQTLEVYQKHNEVKMLRGGILGFDLTKRIDTKAYFFNEDNMVRAVEISK